MKNIDLSQLESTTGGCAPAPCCPPPCCPPPCCPPPCALPAAPQWRWAPREYRAAASYGYGYGYARSARWWR